MPLPYDPTLTMGTPGNALSLTTLPPSGSTSFVVSNLTGLGGRIQYWLLGQTAVSTVNGLQITVQSTSDGANYDTSPYGGYLESRPTTLTQQIWSRDLPYGQLQITFTNLDAVYDIDVKATLASGS